MAQVSNYTGNDDETQFSQTQPAQAGGSTSNTQQPPAAQYNSGAANSSAGAASGTSAASPSSSPAPSAAQKSAGQQGSFHSISALLNANQGQGQQIAQKAVSTADSLGQAAQQAVGQGYQQYSSDVTAATPTGQDYSTATPLTSTTGGTAETNGLAAGSQTKGATTALSAPTTGSTGSNTLGASGIFQNLRNNFAAAGKGVANNAAVAAGQDPTAPSASLPSATDPALVAQAQQAYSGPQSIGTDTNVDNTGIANALTKAQDANNALGTQGGVAATLGDTGGIGQLDELLARQGGGASALAAQQSRFAGLNSALNGTLNDGSLASAAAAKTAAQAANANAAIQARTTNASNADNAAAAAAKTSRQNTDAAGLAAIQQFTQDRTGLGNGFANVGRTIAGNEGSDLTPAQYQSIAQYVTQNPTYFGSDPSKWNSYQYGLYQTLRNKGLIGPIAGVRDNPHYGGW